MNAFEYARPKTTAEAVKFLAAKPGQAAVLAGGTDLLSLMKDGVEAPTRLVSLTAIAELAGIRREADGGIRIGALTTIEELSADAKLGDEFAGLRHAAAGITSPQIRSVGTVGGDLCQRPHCWYYRNGFATAAPGASTAMVVKGDNRYHAILGNDGPAYFVHPSSLAPVLIALGARVSVVGAKGGRELALAELFHAPRKDDEKEIVLGADEILTEVKLPAASGVRSATYEIRERRALDWPLVVAAVALRVESGSIRSARVVLGHVAPIPWLCAGAASALAGAPATPDGAQAVATRAGEAAVAGAKALAHNAYKIRLARVAVKRAVLRALGREV
jgi:xanthine dehydrogenase YagS FAD-binding subunit